ncbi:MAG: adenosylcobinamide-phosphate synthase CbiB [Thermodesulfobacteriota bacterium]
MKRRRLVYSVSGWSIGLAFILDLLLADPPSWPHPVRSIGGAIDRLVKAAGRFAVTPRLRRLAGAFITVIVVGGTWALVETFLAGLEQFSSFLARAAEVWLAYTVLAARGLHDQTWRVALALAENDLPRARRLLGLVVGRDTHDLSRAGIIRALLETLAENLSDGVVAPLFYLALGGPGLALAYKAINTLDSMIGYKEEPFRDLGWASARTDDLANFIPARISAALIALAALILKLDMIQAFKTWWREGGRHTSPNAGRPEAALAGALGVQLGGPSTYRGRLVVKPTIGRPDRPPDLGQVRKAEAIILTAGAIMLVAVMAWRGLS